MAMGLVTVLRTGRVGNWPRAKSNNPGSIRKPDGSYRDHLGRRRHSAFRRAARDRLRLACVIGLVYQTTVAQMRDVLGGLEKVLRAHPKIWPEGVVVRLESFGDSSLNIEVMAWFQTTDWSEFQLIRQEWSAKSRRFRPNR